MPSPSVALDSFLTFGDLLKYLRRRARLTQLELSIAVGYSKAQITPLEPTPVLIAQDRPEVDIRLENTVPDIYLYSF